MKENGTKHSSRTNWERVDSLKDEEIDTSEIPPLDDAFFENAQWRTPKPDLTIAVRVDEETLSWYRSQGVACEERMYEALKTYAEARAGG
jgi:uncharacterized protein (DUF4415 family)